MNTSNRPIIEFGTIGVRSYDDINKPLEEPEIIQDISMDVRGATVLVIDDLGDLGTTMRLVQETILKKGAYKTMGFELYSKPAAKALLHSEFSFGEVSQDTWIISPREKIETLIKRVPVWKANGASIETCARYLSKIGYDEQLINYYLPIAYRQ